MTAPGAKASEYPLSTHCTPTTANAPTLIMKVLSTARTERGRRKKGRAPGP